MQQFISRPSKFKDATVNAMSFDEVMAYRKSVRGCMRMLISDQTRTWLQDQWIRCTMHINILELEAMKCSKKLQTTT